MWKTERTDKKELPIAIKMGKIKFGEKKEKISSGAMFIILNWRLRETDWYTFSLSAVNPGLLSHTSPLCPCSAYKQWRVGRGTVLGELLTFLLVRNTFRALTPLADAHTHPRESVLCSLNYSISDYLITPQTRESPSSWHARREIRTILQCDWRFVRELRREKNVLKKTPNTHAVP